MLQVTNNNTSAARLLQSTLDMSQVTNNNPQCCKAPAVYITHVASN